MNETTDKLLRDLASQLGTTVDNMWDVLVQGSFAYGIGLIPVVLLGLLLGVYAFHSGIYYSKKDYSDDETVVCFFVSGIVMGITMFLTHSCLMHLIAPEYKALYTILEVFK
jgi:hypothetical protein